MTTNTTEATIHGIETLSDGVQTMLLVSMEEGDITAAEAQACVDALRKTPAPMNSPVRSFIADDVWNSLPETDKDALNQAYVSADIGTFLQYVAAGVLPPDATMAIIGQAQKDKSQRRTCEPGFWRNPKTSACYPQVRINGPHAVGFSAPRRNTISAHEVALIATACSQLGADVVMEACRKALAMTAAAKANKSLPSTFQDGAE